MGDSHAASLSKDLRIILDEKDLGLISLIDSGCLPVPGTSRQPLQGDCIRNKQQYWDFIKSTDATVIISARWRLNILGERFNNQEGGEEYGKNGLNHVIDNSALDLASYIYRKITEMSKSNKVVLVSQIPEAGWDVPGRVEKIRRFYSDRVSNIDTSYELYKSENREVIRLLDKLEQESGVSVVRVEELVCDIEETGRCANTFDGQSLYRDNNHPSPLFTKIIVQKMADDCLFLPCEAIE